MVRAQKLEIIKGGKFIILLSIKEDHSENRKLNFICSN